LAQRRTRTQCWRPDRCVRKSQHSSICP
jgi:hypothetical protein